MTASRWILASALFGWAFLPGCAKPAEPTATADATPPNAQPTQAQTRVTGRLLGHDGAPLVHAEIHVARAGAAEQTIPVAADGAFTIDLAEPQWTIVRLTGVDHAEHSLEFLPTGGEHRIDARLGTYKRPDEHESLSGFGRFDGEGPRVNLTFTRRDDGRFVATLARGEAGQKAKEFHYQIADATSVGRTINGTQADRHVYDGGGDYLSVVSLGDADTLELVWDPGALPPAGEEFELSFADPTSSVARMIGLRDELIAERNAAMHAAFTASKGDGPAAAIAEAESKIRAGLRERAAAEADPVLRRMLLVAWIDTLDNEPSDAARAELAPAVGEALAVLGPRDPIWSMREWALATALRYVDDPQYFAAATSEHPDPTVGATLWLSRLVDADEAGELERAEEAMAALANPRFAEVEQIVMAKMYNPDRPSAPGRAVPDFRLTSVDGKTEYSAESMRGKTYVLDFWATWCGPCLAEMPKLHAGYATLNGQEPAKDRKYGPVAEPKLELISISLDHDPKVVAKFRKDQWPMPWAHVVADEATHKLLSEQFGIVGIPMMILVGPDGTILASSPRLDGGSLGEIAGEFLQ